jgi:signal transduction histidine kinase
MATLPTKFASAERAPASSLQEHSNMMLNTELLDKLCEAVNEIILILNRQLQIVFCNSYFASLLGYAKSQHLIGMRPGEALGCVHSCEIDGCGTSEFCSMCGAVSAILNAQQGKADVKECRILRGPKSDAMDLLVRATPLKFRGEDFTILAATDITHEKRRSALERVFFHDLMNTAMAIKTLSANLGRAGLGKVSEISSSIRQAAQQLFEEISAQRDLMYAENNELSVDPVEMTSKALLSQVAKTYESLAKMRNCELEISPQTQNAVFRSDSRIVARVVGNMIKNALEACKEGKRVTLASQPSKGGVCFSVHNPGHMPREVQLQLFKRSFTTKGTGRGLGTYSMKLLTERYLKGRIAFTSSETDGTTFTVTLEC